MCRHAALVAAALLGCCAADPVIEIPGLGPVEGWTAKIDGIHVDEFLGIEYAKAKRWESPVIQQPWEGMKQAKLFGPTCPGSLCVRDSTHTTSEDCLFLNVFRHSNTSTTDLVPVMVFIHGGGYQIGCSDGYSGQGLAARALGEVVVVTINYRLNVFGFLGSDSLRAADNSTGTLGLQDQRTALQWVQNHIRAFGGDPSRVTIFGQSAGAASVSCHLTSPRSRGKGLFRRAITQSLLAPTWAANSLATAEKHFRTVLSHTGCANVTCLKGIEAKELVRISELMTPNVRIAHSLTWAPVIDGVDLMRQPWESLEAGDFDSEIDVMSGTTRDEMAVFMYELGDLTSADFNVLVLDALKTPPLGIEEARELYKENGTYPYPAERGSHNSWWWAVQRALTDSIFTCANRRSMRWLSGKVPNLYNYFMDHATQSQTFVGFVELGDSLGSVTVPHGEELSYVFYCTEFPLETTCAWHRMDERQLSMDLSRYWINFATTGKPGGSWTEQYDAASDSHYVFDIATEYGGKGFHYEKAIRSEVCDFWDKQLFA
eukprot:TRINITY_DN582_c0_g1_i1.p1 TRINITY_DN582_c0_g1~~TRINITY_DN582_c0_g1_i1.p1  ORF type:complete len:544 (+),score=238.29 TRINITY_DN582_c0_g1_i1:78-1709(+)